MNVGNIYGNTAENGGGVALRGVATFNMNGGNIYSNTATSRGGGVWVGGVGSRFTMEHGRIAGSSDADQNTANSGKVFYAPNSYHYVKLGTDVYENTYNNPGSQHINSRDTTVNLV
jgi:hypothetical protein